MDPPMTADYQKPFYLFHYNKPKQPPLKKIKPVDYKGKPKTPVRLNNATKMRAKVIREYASHEPEPYVDYRALALATVRRALAEPDRAPRDTRASQYRYKWTRDVPVVSCRFTEHVMMFKKPPFTNEKLRCCGQYRLRTMEIRSPEKVEEETSGEPGPLIPSILQ